MHAFGHARAMRGLTILATEGVNGTVCGTTAAVKEWKSLLSERFGDITWNDSTANDLVFPRWLVKVREEIVALDKPGSARVDGTHLTPSEWHEALKDPNVVVIDARNTYETAIGTFEGAIDPGTAHFSEFTKFAKNSTIDRKKKVMLYCTGGIRCEKAIVAMKEAGFDNVFQLRGGILSYLKEFPHQQFSGECFVFDHRVAVDQHLAPSRTYSLCPSCGDPATEAMRCVRCDAPFSLCTQCIATKKTAACSKNCRYHYERSLTGDRRS